MLLNLTSIMTACTLMSCAGIVTADDGRQSSEGTSPLSSARGSDDGTGHGFDADRWQDRVPHEPMWLINAGVSLRNSNIHPENNTQGLASWWRGEHAVPRLIDRIQEGYDAGARWFFINRPMGTPGNTHVPGASWLTMTDTKRDVLPEMLTDALLDQFDEPVHVVWFIGSEMADPREFAGWTTGRDDEYYGVGEDDTWERLIGSRVTLGGWISTGASGLAIDHSSPRDERGHFIRLFEQLNQFPFNLAIFGEAYPLTYTDNGRVARDDEGSPILDQHAIESMPWVATATYFEARWPESRQRDSFPLDPDATRMFVWYGPILMEVTEDDQRIDMAHRHMDEGLIPITNNLVIFNEAMNRLRGEESQQSRASSGSSSSSDRSGARSRPSHRTSSSATSKSRPSASSKAQGRRVPNQQLPDRYRHYTQDNPRPE